MKNNIVHGDYEMKLSKEYDRNGIHVEIIKPDYNEIQLKERDSYIISGLTRLLNESKEKDADK